MPPGGRSHGNEDDVGGRDRSAHIRSERKALRPYVGSDQLGDTWFEERNLAVSKGGNFADVTVDAGDLMAEIGKTRAGDKADIAGADHCDIHERLIRKARATTE